MNERIKEIRNHTGLSMRAFGERIGISSASIAKLESGVNNPSEQTIRALCSEFHVSREWLLEGIGPMILEATTADEIIDEVLADGTDAQKAFLRAAARMSADDIETMVRFLRAFSEELGK